MDGKNVGIRLLGKALFTQETFVGRLLCAGAVLGPGIWQRARLPHTSPSVSASTVSAGVGFLPPLRELSGATQVIPENPKSYGVSCPIALSL